MVDEAIGPSRLFWSDIRQRALELFGNYSALHPPGRKSGNAEIDQCGVKRIIDDHIGGIDVLVDDAPLVNVRDSLRERDGQREEGVDAQLPRLPKQIAEGPRSRVLQNQNRQVMETVARNGPGRPVGAQ